MSVKIYEAYDPKYVFDEKNIEIIKVYISGKRFTYNSENGKMQFFYPDNRLCMTLLLDKNLSSNDISNFVNELGGTAKLVESHKK